jgi:hypothetical protein
MKISIGQIYINPGVAFPFSHHMQGWLGEQLSSVSGDSEEFRRKYQADFRLIVRVSADTNSDENIIKGPTVFKRTKDVEYVIFLPFDIISRNSRGCSAAMELLMAGIGVIFEKVGLDTRELNDRKDSIIKHICSDPKMLKEPWPTK